MRFSSNASLRFIFFSSQKKNMKPQIVRDFNTTVADKHDRTYFLKRLGLFEKNIHWPKKAESNNKKVDYWTTNPHSIQGMYSSNDLSKVSIFQGGFINFGCWKNLNNNGSRVDVKKRIKASESMYKQITETADLDNDSSVLDVGCGIGFGCQYILKRYYPNSVVGLDITPEQIARAKKEHQKQLALFKPEQFRFVVGDAMNMPFENNSFTRVISVEAAQHFPSIETFIKESSRVLKPSGKLVFTTFFATNPEGRAAINALIPDHANHCSNATVGEVMSTLAETLLNTQAHSIGEHVWPGLEKWLNVIGYENQWTMVWPALYKHGLVDYFVFKGQAPNGEHNLQHVEVTEGYEHDEDASPQLRY